MDQMYRTWMAAHACARLLRTFSFPPGTERTSSAAECIPAFAESVTPAAQQIPSATEAERTSRVADRNPSGVEQGASVTERPLSAAERVFAVAELLEMFLWGLAPCSLFKIMEVNRTSRALCQTSPIIARRMFLEHMSAGSTVKSTAMAFNPYIQTMFTRCDGLDIITSFDPQKREGDRRGSVRIQLRSHTWLKDLAVRKSAPWHRSFITSHNVSLKCVLLVDEQLTCNTTRIWLEQELDPSICTMGELVAAIHKVHTEYTSARTGLRRQLHDLVNGLRR